MVVTKQEVAAACGAWVNAPNGGSLSQNMEFMLNAVEPMIAQRIRDVDDAIAEVGRFASQAGSLWRTGRKVGRTIYAGTRDNPDGLLIGMMDTRQEAELVVQAVNTLLQASHLTGERGGGIQDHQEGGT